MRIAATLSIVQSSVLRISHKSFSDWLVYQKSLLAYRDSRGFPLTKF
jgi:hypothetical protein